MSKLSDRTVLLFYKDYETDKWVRGDRYLKRLVRPIYNWLSKRQKGSGFLVAYRLLVQSLERAGYTVERNNYRLARRHPEHPVGLFGYPDLLERWDLPNPAVLGSGLYDHPGLAPRLMEDPRNRFYLVPGEWMRRMFEPFYGDRAAVWYAGIDLALWRDTRADSKPVDVLVYDKIRWDRDRYEPGLLQPILDRLAHRGLRVEVLRYRMHDHDAYREALRRSRSFLFLCEHETQGLAYQEALASNVPVIAWDNGYWLDPQRFKLGDEEVPASSVPYFSEECGERFRDMGEFDGAFERFWSRLEGYQPRRFVARELSMEKSAALYMSYYTRAALEAG